MPFIEYVYSVLIVSSSKSFNTAFPALLSPRDYAPVDIVHSISHAQRKLAEHAYDLVIINAPLTDDPGWKLAIDICSGRHTVVLLLVKNDIYDEIYARVFEHGVLTLPKPTSPSMINQAMDWMRAISRQLNHFEKKTLTLEEKMTEIRIVNRAKWALIESRQMTESDAHRYIEKQAMDHCVTKREIAEDILKACI